MPFRGDSALLPVLLKGDIDFAASAVSSIHGKPDFRPLVIFSDRRHPAFPEVPTAKELGVATGVPPGHNGLYAPKGVPAAVRTGLEAACSKALTHDTVRQTVANTGQTITYLSGADFHAQTAADYHVQGRAYPAAGAGHAVGRFP